MRCLPACLVLLLALPASAQLAPLVPRDDGAADPSFVTFRARLVEAIAHRDVEAVLAAVAPEARFSFGDAAGGPAALRAVWFDGDRPRETFWHALGRVVALGSVRSPDRGRGSFEGDVQDFVAAPYTYLGFPDDLDPFRHAAIVGENVNVRARPSLDAEVLSALTYTIVPLRGVDVGADGQAWAQIELADGRTGYTAARYVLNPIDFRIGYLKRDGRWQIVFFVSGD